MRQERYNLHDLEEQTRRGEAGAADRFQEALSSPLVYMVRRALRARTAFTPLDRRILAEEGRVLTRLGDRGDPEWLVHEVARRVSEGLLERTHRDLAPTRRLAETVVA